jgi:hypothetical protein
MRDARRVHARLPRTRSGAAEAIVRGIGPAHRHEHRFLRRRKRQARAVVRLQRNGRATGCALDSRGHRGSRRHHDQAWAHEDWRRRRAAVGHRREARRRGRPRDAEDGPTDCLPYRVGRCRDCRAGSAGSRWSGARVVHLGARALGTRRHVSRPGRAARRLGRVRWRQRVEPGPSRAARATHEERRPSRSRARVARRRLVPCRRAWRRAVPAVRHRVYVVCPGAVPRRILRRRGSPSAG